MTRPDGSNDPMFDAQLRAAAERLPRPAPIRAAVRARIEESRAQRESSRARRATWVALAAVVLVSLGLHDSAGDEERDLTPDQDQVAQQTCDAEVREPTHARGLAGLTRRTIQKIDRPLAQLEAPLQQEADSLTLVFRRSKERFVRALPGLVSDRLR